MKSIVIVLILPVILLLGCQKEEENPSGDPNENPGEGQTEEPVTEATIGSDGGLLKNDSITITIPEGAFLQNEELNISALHESSNFGEFLSSGRFMLEGLPESYDKPLKVCIAHNGELEGESFVVVGEQGMNLESGESEVFYEFITAKDSSGFLICEIPGRDDSVEGSNLKSASGTSAEKKWISIEVVSKYFSNSFTNTKKTYKIYLPANRNDAFTPRIVGWLDIAYGIVNLVVNDYEMKEIIPYHIYLANLSDKHYCRFAWKNGTDDNSRKPKGLLAINVNRLEDTDEMKIMIGREVLRSVLFSFDPKYPTLRPIDQIPHRWLDQAVISWSEGIFDPGKVIPSDFPGNELKPFNGMQAGIMQGDGSFKQNITDHGRGMASFIRYSDIGIPEGLLTDIYTGIEKGEHPVKAIKSSCDILGLYPGFSPFYTHWYNFFARYLEGKIYGVTGNTFLSSIPESCQFNIDVESDTVRVFQHTYPDLSAKLFRINLNDPGFKENGTLEFSITGGNAMTHNLGGLLYGYNNGKLTFLGEMGQLFENSDFQSYGTLVFLLCNTTANDPYTGNSTIELTIVAKRKNLLPYGFCQLEMSVLGDHLVERDPPEVEPYHSTFQVFGTWKFSGGCGDNTFTGTFDPSYHPETTHGTLNVTFDDDMNITHFDFTGYDRSLKADTLAWELIGTSLDKTYQSGANLQHELVGTGVCGSLQGVLHYSESTHSSGGTVQYTVVNHTCNEFSLLKFSFGKH